VFLSTPLGRDISPSHILLRSQHRRQCSSALTKDPKADVFGVEPYLRFDPAMDDRRFIRLRCVNQARDRSRLEGFHEEEERGMS